MSLYTSKDEFDLEKRVHFTNEIPPYDMYDALNSTLKNKLWQWVLGYTKVTFDMPYASKTVDDNGNLVYERNPSNGEVYYKLVNGEYADNYGPVSTVDSTGNETTYSQIEEYGVVLPEFDYLLHEVYRYLDNLYPDHPDYTELLTNNEFNDMITNAGAIIDYTPDNAFFEKLASSLGLDESDEDVEAAMIKIRNLRNEAFRRKLYGSKAGYRMIANDIYQSVTVFPVATYLPLKPISYGLREEEFSDSTSPAVNRTALKSWNEANGLNYTSDEYIKYILTKKRDIDTYSKLYYSKFRLIDYDGSNSSYPKPKDNNIYITGFSLPFNEYSIFEYPVSDDADSLLASAKISGQIKNINDVKETTYITSINTDSPQLEATNDLFAVTSLNNINSIVFDISESTTNEVHSISTSLKNNIKYQTLYNYPNPLNIDIDSDEFDIINSVDSIYTGNVYPLTTVGEAKIAVNSFKNFYGITNGKGFTADKMKKLVSSIGAIYNPNIKDTLYLTPDITVKFYPESVGVYYDTSANNTGYIFRETPIVWGSKGNGIDINSYISDVFQSNDTSPNNLSSSNMAQITGFTKGYIGYANESDSVYYRSKHDTLPDIDSAVGRDRFAVVVENENGNDILFEGNIHTESTLTKSRTITLNNNSETFSFGADGLSLYEKHSGSTYHADYVELQITAIPVKKSERVLRAIYEDEYDRILSTAYDSESNRFVGVIPYEKEQIKALINTYEKNYVTDINAYNDVKSRIASWLKVKKNETYKLYTYGNVEADTVLEHYYADDQYVTDSNGTVRNMGEEIYKLVKELISYYNVDTATLLSHVKNLKEAKDIYDKMLENRSFIYQTGTYTDSTETEQSTIQSLIQPNCKVLKMLEGKVAYDSATKETYVSYNETSDYGYGTITNISLGNLNVASLFDAVETDSLISPAFENNIAKNASIYLRKSKSQTTYVYKFNVDTIDNFENLTNSFVANISNYISINKPVSSLVETDIIEKSSTAFVENSGIINDNGEYRVLDPTVYAYINNDYVAIYNARYTNVSTESSEYYKEDSEGKYLRIISTGEYIESYAIYNKVTIYKDINLDISDLSVSFNEVIQYGVQTVKFNYAAVDESKAAVLHNQYKLSINSQYLSDVDYAVFDTNESSSKNYATGMIGSLSITSKIMGNVGNLYSVAIGESEKNIFRLFVYFNNTLVFFKNNITCTLADDKYTYYVNNKECETNLNGELFDNEYVSIKPNNSDITIGKVSLSGGNYKLSDVYNFINTKCDNYKVIQNSLLTYTEYMSDNNTQVVSCMGDGLRNYCAGNYSKNNANITISDIDRTTIQIESVIKISEGTENKIYFESDSAREMYKSLSVGDIVFGPTIDSDDNNVFIIDIGNNEITVNTNLQQSGTYVLNYSVKMNIYQDDTTDYISLYKETLYNNGLYSITNPYEHGLWPSSDYPNVSKALLESLPDISFFDMSESSNDGSLNVPSMHTNGDTTFKHLIKETHYEDYQKYIDGTRNSSTGAIGYQLLPSDIKFNNELFVEINLNKLLNYESRTGSSPVLMSVDWLDYLENSLNYSSRATDKVNIGVNLMLETDTSGFYTLLENTTYTDPNVQSKFITLNYNNNMWPQKSLSEDDWTVPAYAQIGTNGSGRKSWFKNPNDIVYPNMYGVNTYDTYKDPSEYNETSDFYLNNGELRKVSVYASNGTVDTTSSAVKYTSVENPLFEIPLGEYNSVLKYTPSNVDESSRLLGTITQVSFYEQVFKDITRLFSEDEKIITVQTENVYSENIMDILAVYDENGDIDSSVTTFTYGSGWEPVLTSDSKKIDYSGLSSGKYYYISESASFADLDDGEVLNFNKGDIIFVYTKDSKIVYDIRNFQYICPIGNGLDIVTTSGTTYKVSTLNEPVKNLDTNNYETVTIGANDITVNDNANLITRLMQYYFRTTNSFTSNQVNTLINKSNLKKLIEIYNTDGKIESNYKVLDNSILYYVYVGTTSSYGTEPYFDTVSNDISVGTRIAFAYINEKYYLFKLKDTTIYGISLPVSYYPGVQDSEIEILNGEDTIAEDKGISTTSKLNGFSSLYTLPHGYITPGSYEFNFTVDPHFTSNGYLYNDDGTTIDKSNEIPFCITRGAIYYDELNKEFYCYSSPKTSNGTFDTSIVKKIAIEFNDNIFFKNVLNINGTYQVRNAIESGSNEAKETPTFSSIQSIDFPIDKIASNDRVLGVRVIDLRSIYNNALEPTFFSNFADLNYQIYGFDADNNMIIASVPEDGMDLKKATFITNIGKLFPTISEYDEKTNYVTTRDATSSDYNFIDSTGNTISFVSESDKIGIIKANITQSPMKDTYVRDDNKTLSDYEFKYYKNALIFRGSVDKASPNVITIPSTDSSEYSLAINKLTVGDTLLNGAALTNMGFENRFNISVVDTDNNKVIISKIRYANNNLLVIGKNNKLYYMNGMDLTQLTGTIKCSKSPISLVNFSIITDASFDYENSAWIVEATDENNSSSVLYQIPVFTLGTNYTPSQMYSNPSTVYIKESDATEKFYGSSIGATKPADSSETTATNATEDDYIKIDSLGVIKNFVPTAATLTKDAVSKDVLYRDVSLNYAKLTMEESSNSAIALTVNASSLSSEEESNIESDAVNVDTKSLVSSNYEITVEPYVSDTLLMANKSGTTFIPVNNNNARAIFATSNNRNYAIYAKGRDAFIKSPTALVTPVMDTSTGLKYDTYEHGFAYSGETTMDSYWKRARLPVINDKLFYNLRNLISQNVSEAETTLKAEAQTAYARYYLYTTSEVLSSEDTIKEYANVKVSGDDGFNILSLNSSTEIRGIVSILSAITGCTSVDIAKDTVSEASNIATYDNFYNVMYTRSETFVSVPNTNNMVKIKYTKSSELWTIDVYGFKLQEMSIKDKASANYIGADVQKVPVLGTDYYVEYTMSDDVVTDYKGAYAWYAYYLDYYIFGDSQYSDYTLTSNINSATFTDGSLMLSDNYGNISSIDLGNLTKRSDIENPENWKVSSLPTDYSIITQDENLSGDYVYYYNNKFYKAHRTSAVFLSSIFKTETMYVNNGVLILGGYIYSQSDIDTIYKERTLAMPNAASSLTDEQKENLKELQSMSPLVNNCFPAVFYSTDNGSSFKAIPFSSKPMSNKNSTYGSSDLYVNAIRFLNDEYQFNVAYLGDTTDTVLPYYYKVSKDQITGTYDFDTGFEIAQKDTETQNIGNSEEFDVDVNTGITTSPTASGSASVNSASTGNFRFFVTPNKDSFYLATLKSLRIGDEVSVASKTSAAITLSSNIVDSGTGKLDVLLSFKTNEDIYDQTLYINKDHIGSYLNNMGKFKVAEIIQVDNKSTADRFYSYRELIDDSSDTNGYPISSEDTIHIYYNYTTVEDTTGQTQYIANTMYNESNNPVKLCNDDGRYYLYRNALGNRLYDISERFNMGIDDFVNADDVLFSSLDKAANSSTVVSTDTLLNKYIDIDDNALKIIELNKDNSVPYIRISCGTTSLVSSNLIDTLKNNNIIYDATDYNSTRQFAKFLVDYTGELTEQQYEYCLSSETETEKLSALTTYITSITFNNSVNSSIEKRYTKGVTSLGNSVWYDNYYSVYPIKYIRNITGYASMPYMFSGSVSYKALKFSDINNTSYNPISGVYLSQFGYGGTRNNTDTDWSNKLPWQLDPDAFKTYSDLADGEEIYSKNSLGKYIYLTDYTGKRIVCKNAEKEMTANDIFTISSDDFDSGETTKSIYLKDSNNNKDTVTLYKISKASLKMFTPTNTLYFGNESFDRTFYIYKSGKIINKDITDISIQYVYMNASIAKYVDANKDFDIDNLKNSLLSYTGISSSTYADATSKFSSMGITGLKQLKVSFTYDKETYSFIFDADISSTSESSNTIVFDRPLFYLTNSDGTYKLINFDFANSKVIDSTSLNITISNNTGKDLKCSNNTSFYASSGMAIALGTNAVFSGNSLALPLNTSTITTLDTPTLNISTSDEKSFENIELPIFSIGEIRAFSLLKVSSTPYKYWSNQELSVNNYLYINDTNYTDNATIEYDTDTKLIKFYADATKKVLLASLTMSIDTKYYTNTGYSTNDIINAGNTSKVNTLGGAGRFTVLSAYDTIYLSNIQGHKYSISFPIYIVDKFRGRYITSDEISNWIITYDNDVIDNKSSSKYFKYDSPYLSSVKNANLYDLDKVNSLTLTIAYDGSTYTKEFKIEHSMYVSPRIESMDLLVSYLRKGAGGAVSDYHIIGNINDKSMLLLDHTGGISTTDSTFTDDTMKLTTTIDDYPTYDSRYSIIKDMASINGIDKNVKELQTKINAVSSDSIYTYKDTIDGKSYDFTDYLTGTNPKDNPDKSIDSLNKIFYDLSTVFKSYKSGNELAISSIGYYSTIDKFESDLNGSRSDYVENARQVNTSIKAYADEVSNTNNLPAVQSDKTMFTSFGDFISIDSLNILSSKYSEVQNLIDYLANDKTLSANAVYGYFSDIYNCNVQNESKLALLDNISIDGNIAKHTDIQNLLKYSGYKLYTSGVKTDTLPEELSSDNKLDYALPDISYSNYATIVKNLLNSKLDLYKKYYILTLLKSIKDKDISIGDSLSADTLGTIATDSGSTIDVSTLSGLESDVKTDADNLKAARTNGLTEDVYLNGKFISDYTYKYTDTDNNKTIEISSGTTLEIIENDDKYADIKDALVTILKKIDDCTDKLGTDTSKLNTERATIVSSLQSVISTHIISLIKANNDVSNTTVYDYITKLNTDSTNSIGIIVSGINIIDNVKLLKASTLSNTDIETITTAITNETNLSDNVKNSITAIKNKNFYYNFDIIHSTIMSISNSITEVDEPELYIFRSNLDVVMSAYNKETDYSKLHSAVNTYTTNVSTVISNYYNSLGTTCSNYNNSLIDIFKSYLENTDCSSIGSYVYTQIDNSIHTWLETITITTSSDWQTYAHYRFLHLVKNKIYNDFTKNVTPLNNFDSLSSLNEGKINYEMYNGNTKLQSVETREATSTELTCSKVTLTIPADIDANNVIIKYNNLNDINASTTDKDICINKTYTTYVSLFWEYKDGNNILPYVETDCSYMFSFEKGTPIFINDTDTISLKVNHMNSDDTSTVMVYGITDYVKLHQPKFNSMYDLIDNLGYVIENDDNVLAESKDTSGIYGSTVLDNISLKTVDEDNVMFSFTNGLSVNDAIAKAATAMGISLDDGNKHYLQIKILTHSTITTNIRTANDKDYFVRLELSDIDDFTPDRIYFNPSGYPEPSFVLNNVVFNSDNIDKYYSNSYKNNNSYNVYRCDASGNLIGYTMLTGNSAKTFNTSDSSCAGYITDDNGVITNVAQMTVLDGYDNTLSDAVVSYEPLYKSCKDWYKSTFYLKGKESNPYWQSLIINSKFDKNTKAWVQNTKTIQYVRSSSTMVEQTVDEDDRYFNVSKAILATVHDGALEINYNPDYVDLTTGEIRFIVNTPASKYKNTKSFIKYGISANNSFYINSDSMYRNIWSGESINLSGSIASSYTINSTRNYANTNDKTSDIKQITELGLFNKNHELIAYAVFPPIEYRTDTQHVSFTCFVKMGSCSDPSKL